MNLLIDCTNLKTGGAIQVATSFINDLNKLKLEVSYYIVLTPQLSRNFVREKFSNFFNFVDLPKGVSNKYKIARFLKRLENELSIDKVFCVFGPKYYKSKVPAAVGFAYGHYIYGDSPFYK